MKLRMAGQKIKEILGASPGHGKARQGKARTSSGYGRERITGV